MNDQTLNIKFVQEVEKYPCLYNYTLSDYSRKDLTERAWSEVGKIFNLTHSQCKEKWQNLRAVFVRHTKPAPSRSSSKNKKPYYLADAMQFTIPYIKALNNTMACPPPRPTAPNTDIGSNHRKKKTSSIVDNGIMEYFKAKKAKLQKKSEDIEDPKRMFLLSLLPDMKAMSESQTRTFKRRVLALVDEILDESPRTLAPPQRPTPEYNFETQSVLLSTQGLSLSNEQQATPAYNVKTESISLSTQELSVSNEQQATPAYNVKTESISLSTQELSISNEQQATPTYNVETQSVSLSTQELSVSNEQQATPAS